MGIPTPTMTAATPHIAVFLTSGKIKCLEFIYPASYTQSCPCVCLECLVSCIHYIRQILPPKETVSTLSRSANTSWLFFKLHLTTTLLLTRQTPNQRAIGSKLLKKSHLASWHQNYDQWDEGSSTYHLSYQLRTIGF